jgi:hypothetical protein
LVISSWLELAEVDLLVAARRQDDGFDLVEVHVIDRAEVAGQFVHQFPTLHVPHVHVPGAYFNVVLKRNFTALHNYNGMYAIVLRPPLVCKYMYIV